MWRKLKPLNAEFFLHWWQFIESERLMINEEEQVFGSWEKYEPKWLYEGTRAINFESYGINRSMAPHNQDRLSEFSAKGRAGIS